MRSEHSIAYLRPVDGLRAVSVLAVIAYHLDPVRLPGGYFGVDVFFVISGFLITGIIRRQLTDGCFALRDFFARRVRRILPALSVELGLTCLLFCWLDPYRAAQFGESVQRGLLMQGNLAARDAVGAYWGAGAAGHPYLHIWSLGVEEQFYAAFPLLLLLLARVAAGKGERPVLWALSLLAAVSFLLCVLCSLFWPTAAFYLLPTRAWELLAGGCLACYMAERPAAPPGRAAVLSWSGAALVAASFLWAPPPWVFLSVLPVAGAMMVIAASRSDTPVSRALSAGPPVVVGRISYSLYLWHWPAVLVFAGDHGPSAVGTLFALLATFVLAALSYFCVEQPLRAARHGVAAALLLAAAAFFGSRWAVRSFGPEPLRTPEQIARGEFPDSPGGFPLVEVRGALYSSNPKMLQDEAVRRAPFRAVNPPAPLPVGTPVRRLALEGRRLFVCWGDSHAMMLAPVFDEFALGAGHRAEFHIWWGGDPSMERPRSRFGDSRLVSWFKDALDVEGFTHAQLVEYERCGQEMIRRGCDGVVFMMRYHDRDFGRYAATFDAILARSPLVFVQQPPTLPIGDGYASEYFAAQRDLFGRDLSALRLVERPAAREGRRRFEEAMLSRYAGTPNFTFLRTEPAFTLPDGGIRWRSDSGALLYLDDDHLTEEGCRSIVRELAGVLR